MPGPHEGDPGWWNSQTATLDDARFAVWSVPPGDYDRTTAACIETIEGWAPVRLSRLLDVGCGIGRLALPFAERHPAATVVGLDPAEGMLAHAAREAGRLSLDNVEWRHAAGIDADTIGAPVDLAYSVVVFQHNDRHVCAAIVESVTAVLEVGGRFVYQLVGDVDFGDPGHVPDDVAVAWATDAGLDVVALEHGLIFPDWTWVVAERTR